jgi:thiamine pyrophosphate-dependent acetolactate synthase large subunit-like protein
MTSLTEDEIRRLITKAMNRAFDGHYGPTVVPIPDDKPSSCSVDDDELSPLAPVSIELVPSSIPLIPSFPKAVEDALDSSCVDDDDAL